MTMQPEAAQSEVAQLRRLVPADALPYRALMLAAYDREPEAFTSTAAERAALPLAWWEGRLAVSSDAAEVVVGAWLGDQLVGAVGISFSRAARTRHKASVFGMVVDPAARRSGLGRRLLAQGLDEARQVAATRIVQLTVSASNAAAVALYRQGGFEPFGAEPYAVSLGEGYVTKLHLWRAIAPLGERPDTAVARDAIAFVATLPDELPAIASLWRAAWSSANPMVTTVAPLSHWLQRVEQEFVAPCRLLTAWRNGQRVGFLVVDPEARLLSQLQVDPAAQRTGIGRQAIAWMRTNLGRDWSLYVADSNHGARAFYARMGLKAGEPSTNPETGRLRWRLFDAPEVNGP